MKLVSERPVVTAGAANAKAWHVLLFALFFVSGFCGLLYQTVWLRLALASFGVVTPVVSVIISVFMLGLGLGSYLAGKYVNAVRRATGLSSITLYGLVELVIAAGAFAVPACFQIGEQWLLHSGQANSTEYLLLSAIVIASSICLFSTAMGMTFPLVMSFIEELDTDDRRSFSFLYMANLAGAVCGTLITALVLIELLGFRATLFVAAIMNVSIAATAIAWAKSRNRAPSVVSAGSEPAHTDERVVGSAFGNWVLFVTGFTSMAMEVIWTRQFTMNLSSLVYSFASLLATYLLASCIGSLLYRRHWHGRQVAQISTLLAVAGSSALLPALVVATCPSKVSDLLSIVPFSAVLGYLTPLLIDQLSGGKAEAAGRAYALNVIGCVVGPLVAGYFLLPTFSHRIALIILAAPYLVLYLRAQWTSAMPQLHRPALCVLLLGTMAASFVCQGQDEDQSRGPTRRDYVATVLCAGQGLDKCLYVNGVTMTKLTPICKFMADLPLACRATKPSNALVICFGMGTTYRSLLSWNIDVTAVELVPSVRDSFAFFHSDAQSVLSRANGRIVIDDGRRFLNRTKELYDVIVIDPPPPIQAAGSSLLYSTGFYHVIGQHLKPGGVMQTWYPGGKGATLAAVARSLSESFPYVRCYRSVEGWGFHFLASNQPIADLTVEQMLQRMPPSAIADLSQWTHRQNEGREMIAAVLQRPVDIHSLFNAASARITDDTPFNEYFFLRETGKRIASKWITHRPDVE